jgi:hypothetical protein
MSRPSVIRTARASLLVGVLAASSLGCWSRPTVPDKPIQRVQLKVINAPPVPPTVPAQVQPGAAIPAIELTTGVVVAIELTVYQEDQPTTGATFAPSPGSGSVYRTSPRPGGAQLLFWGEGPGSAGLEVRAPNAANPLVIPVTVKDQ